MRKRKRAGLFLVFILLLGMISGCSPTEKDFFNFTAEMSRAKVCQQTGSIEVNITELPDEFFEESDVSKEVVQKALNEHRIDYFAEVDYNRGILYYDLAIVNKSTEQKITAVSLLFKDKTYYLKIDELLPFVKQFCDAEEKQMIDEKLAGAKYISLNLQDLNSIIAAGPTTVDNTNPMTTVIKRQQIYLDLIQALMNNVYDNFEGSFISKNNNQYTITLRGDRLVETYKPIIIYTINNIDKLGSTLTRFVNGLSQSDLDMLGLSFVPREEMLAGIDEMVQDVNQNRETYLESIEAESVQAQTELTKLLGDSEMTCTYEKLDLNTYKDSAILRLHIKNEEMQNLDCTLSIKDTLRDGSFEEIPVPTENVLTFKQIQDQMPRIMTVWVDDQFYCIEQGMYNDYGDITPTIIDNQIYLPMRLVVEAMDEQASWDEAAGQAYVERDGQQIVLNGRIIDGVTCISKKELEKLGYIISWDDYCRSVIIEKR